MEKGSLSRWHPLGFLEDRGGWGPGPGHGRGLARAGGAPPKAPCSEPGKRLQPVSFSPPEPPGPGPGSRPLFAKTKVLFQSALAPHLCSHPCHDL